MAVLDPNKRPQRRPVILPVRKPPEYFTGTNPACKINRDAKGTSYQVRNDRGFTGAHIWWSPSPRTDRPSAPSSAAPLLPMNVSEALLIRQLNGPDEEASVLSFSQGQVYELIDALNRAMEKP